MTTPANTLPSPLGPAALQVLGTPELLDHIAQNVIVDAQLASLCLVNRTFNGIFTRYLYRNVHLKRKDLDDRTMEEVIRGRTSAIPDLFGCLSPNHFTWSSIEKPAMGQPSPAEWPLSSRMLRGLRRSCPRLNALSFNLETRPYLKFCRDDHSVSDSEHEEDVPYGMKYGIADFLIFTGLTSLKLCGMQADLDLWLQTIALVLGTSPGLCELALSLSDRLVEQLEEQEELQSLFNFFINLAEQYARLGHEPLRLRTLELYYPILLRVDSEGGFGYLNRLTDLSYLRTLQIFNSNEMLHSLGDGPVFADEEVHYAWPAVTPEVMPNLGRLTVSVWDENFYDWYSNADPAFISQLELRNMGEMWHDKGPDPLNILLLPSPDKLHTPKGLFLPPLGRPPFTTDPWMNVPTNAENGKVPIDWNRLGEIKDFHCLRTLGIQLDTGEPLDELVAILERMDGLKKLAIMHVGRQSEKAWLEGFGRFETCEHIARRCKGLTYLQLGGISMRIWRSAAGEVDLEELSQREYQIIGEFFREEDFD